MTEKKPDDVCTYPLPKSGPKRARHGLSKTPEWKAWQHLRARCYSPTDKRYVYYGGRGITVCDAWLNSFQTFLSDMGPRPPGHTLDRIDVNGNYEPANCRWASAKQQQRNKRDNTYVTIRGETRTASEWCEISGVGVATFLQRLHKLGWTGERLLQRPCPSFTPKQKEPAHDRDN